MFSVGLTAERLKTSLGHRECSTEALNTSSVLLKLPGEQFIVSNGILGSNGGHLFASGEAFAGSAGNFVSKEGRPVALGEPLHGSVELLVKSAGIESLSGELLKSSGGLRPFSGVSLDPWSADLKG